MIARYVSAGRGCVVRSHQRSSPPAGLGLSAAAFCGSFALTAACLEHGPRSLAWATEGGALPHAIAWAGMALGAACTIGVAWVLVRVLCWRDDARGVPPSRLFALYLALALAAGLTGAMSADVASVEPEPAAVQTVPDGSGPGAKPHAGAAMREAWLIAAARRPVL